MPFPEREYYTLKHAAARWTATLDEVQRAVVVGKLRVSTWIDATLAHTITEHRPDNATRSALHSLVGYVRVPPHACRCIFSKGSVRCRTFLKGSGKEHYSIVDSLPKIEVVEKDLVILNADARAFEKEHKLAASKPCKVISVHKLRHTHLPMAQPIFNHQNDFRLVRLDGLHFTFGEIQSSIVRQLYEAANTDNPWLHGKTLLANAGSSSLMMRDAFRHQQNWKELIHSNGRGYYRLSPICSPIPAPPDTSKHEKTR